MIVWDMAAFGVGLLVPVIFALFVHERDEQRRHQLAEVRKIVSSAPNGLTLREVASDLRVSLGRASLLLDIAAARGWIDRVLLEVSGRQYVIYRSR